MIRTILIGASGYTGGEAAALLLRHPGARLVGAFGSPRRGADGADAPRLDALHPRLRGQTDLRVSAFEIGAATALQPRVALLATPHEVSDEVAPELLAAGVTVVDLSAAFRFRDAALFQSVYGFAPRTPALLEIAAYGLPEINRDAIRRARLIACAGCYVTAAVLPLRALARAGAIDRSRPPIIDAISGVSGAGRTPTPTTHFCEVSLTPYRVLAHRHTPEIAEQVGGPVYFTPHLAPYDRGIVATIHVDLAPGWSGARAREALASAYGQEPFVRLLPAGEWPSVGAVERTNFCDVALACDDDRRHLIVVSALDNLLKGAAGQGVQCLNLACGLPETAGLL